MFRTDAITDEMKPTFSDTKCSFGDSGDDPTVEDYDSACENEDSSSESTITKSFLKQELTQKSFLLGQETSKVVMQQFIK